MVGTEEALPLSKGTIVAWIHRGIKALQDRTQIDPLERLGSLGTSSSLEVDAGEADLVSFYCPLGFPSKAGCECGNPA